MDAYLTGLPAITPPGVGSAGDAGEGIDVAPVIAGTRGHGSGGSYTPLPGVLPTKDHLDYVQKLSTAGLLAIGFVMLVLLGIVNPARMLNVLARGAQRQAGVA